MVQICDAEFQISVQQQLLELRQEKNLLSGQNK
jgi:hypothetical protein